MTENELNDITAGIATVAGKIIKLHENGVSNQAIVQHLGVSANHVYSTLSRARTRNQPPASVDDAKGAIAAAPSDQPSAELLMLRVEENGDLVIPSETLTSLELGQGAEVAVFVSAVDIKVMTSDEALTRYREGRAADLASPAVLAELVFRKPVALLGP